jgi:hypothetical protein
MRVIRIILIIIGSALFIPVSCTIGVFSGTLIVASLDSRDVSDGDSVHTLFSVVAKPKNDQEGFWFLSLDQAEQLKESAEPFSFLMSKPTGNMNDGSLIYSFQVLEDHKKEQLIEVIETYKDRDNKIWSRYRATENDIYPVSSRMFYFGYMFNAVPFAFIFSLLLYVICRILKRYIRAKEK